MTPQEVIDQINALIVPNNSQDITAEILNPILEQMVLSLFDITGNKENLDTNTRVNLVAAINELKDQIDSVNGSTIYYGSADPNVTPPNGGNFLIADYYVRSNGTFWINTAINGVGWLNLTDEQIIFGNSLPISGVTNKLYIQTSDNSIWRWTEGGSIQYPTPQFIQIGGGLVNAVLFTEQNLTLEQQGTARDNIGVSSIFKQLFTYNSTTNPTKSFQLDFIPTSVVYLTDTGSFLQGSDVGKTDYSIDTETAILTINVDLKTSAEIIICYEHQNQTP